ncbi:hypothetical protein MACH09_24440 [Vibrio sp. MACH09]|uniref:hypothetical protein n=1 Tax=Vibrio sp. MACH09 TaxID=3025122 RepID=UPI0027928C8F|nr:hypothetical protein [Vibrio sp. MACH09]GLO61936.1 hypothetical protein MACH09_24440 [Vibrio sp. MACH09]
MMQPTDKNIAKWINDKRFSELLFLNDCWKTSGNNKYPGYYYFCELSKKENTDLIWNYILEVSGNISDAYLYLGEIGHEIYNSFDKYHICSDFYRKSIEYDENNSQSLWNLYYVSGRDNEILLLRSLRLDLERGELDKIKYKLINTYIYEDFGSKFSIEDWQLFKEILLASESRNQNGLLAFTYYHLGEIELGEKLIRQAKNNAISYDSLRPYLEDGIISLEEAADKVFDFQTNEVLSEDNEALFLKKKASFEESKKKDKEARFTTNGVIASAFRARAYSDVIQLFEQRHEDDNYLNYDQVCNLQYLLSQLFQGNELCKRTYDEVTSRSDNLRDEEKVLFEFFKAYSSIAKIKDNIREKIFYLVFNLILNFNVLIGF